MRIPFIGLRFFLYKVVKKMKVSLISHNAESAKIVSTAARLCYSDMNIDEAVKDMSMEEAEKRTRKMVELGHHSTLEHISFTFGIEGVSRALTHQLVRHRIASFSQQSQRYINFENFEYVTPKSIKKNEAIENKYIELMNSVRDFYKEMLDADIPKEDARYIFPNSVSSKLILTMNARSLLNFFSLRLCNRAQYEIRSMAMEMYNCVKDVVPSIFEKAGPSCVSEGICRENYPECPRKKNLKK